jgi:hypothetical protein
LGAFITALVTRYNDPAGVWRLANPTLGKGLIAIEGWNEPDQRGAYWWGTDAQLIDVEWTVTAAAKAVDSTILRLSVSSDTWANNLNRWMNQAGAINTGKTGKDCWDALSLHWYNYADAGVVDGDWSTQNGGYTFSPLSGANAPLTIRKLLAANGQNLNLWPLWFTECGIDYRDMPSAQMTDFLSRSTDSRYKHWMRMMMRAAAEGAQVFNSYAWEVSYSGYLCNDPSGTARAISDAHSYLAGRTMTSLRFMTSGPYTHWATFASGSDLIV